MISRVVNISPGPNPGFALVSGYAADFDAYEVHGGPVHGGWVERITREAFEKALAARPDMGLIRGTEDRLLARTRAGDLKLSVDDAGFKVEALIDAGQAAQLRDGIFSFSFRVKDQDWSPDYNHRLITELNLEKGDIYINAEPVEESP